MKRTYDQSIKWIASLSLLCLLLIATSCKKDKDKKNPDEYTLTGNGSGTQEVPANSTTGSGTLTGTYNKATNKLTYNISWNGLTGTAAALHFHGPALAGANAGVAVPLTITNSAITGGANGEVTITETQEADLLAGKWYWNVHTAAFPGGELRGQVAATQ